MLKENANICRKFPWREREREENEGFRLLGCYAVNVSLPSSR
jgi:hypothetical protein